MPTSEYVGRWSRLVARDFLGWLDPPAGLRWLDVGCGTGALSAAIIERCAPTEIDRHRPVGRIHRHGARPDHRSAGRFEQGDGRPCPAGGASGRRRLRAGAEFRRRSGAPCCARCAGPLGRRHGGAVRLGLRRRNAADALFLGRRGGPRSRRPRPRRGRALPALPAGRPGRAVPRAGLEAVATRPIDVPTVFRDFDDYWAPFLGGQGPAPAYCMSLPQDRRLALRERLRATLPAQADGPIALIARAWAVRGTVPA